MFCLRSFAGQIRVTDGAYGSALQKKGLSVGGCPELANADNPEAVRNVARSYVEAGSEVIITNSLGANRFMLAPHSAADRAAELAEAAAAIAKEAVEGTDVKVFGSFGPTGKIVMMGQVSEAELSAAFAETSEALARGGSDAIVLETFSELAEAEIAVKAVKESCDLPVVVSMTFGCGPEKTCTMMGNTPAELAAMAEAAGADAVGANCGVGPEPYVRVARMLAEATKLPIWIKPNAGLPIVENGKTVFAMGPHEFASFVPQLIGAGTNFIGGCCGTTPDHIRAVRKAVDTAA
jgi:5-methyltetrahydrofolate--homocysteine methyltransferase